MTVVIVTHDDKVANNIGRVIRMSNGRGYWPRGRGP